MIDIEHALKEIVFKQLKAQATESSNFFEDLGADSLDMVEIGMSCEEAFGIGMIEDEEIHKIKTFGDLLSFIKSKCK